MRAVEPSPGHYDDGLPERQSASTVRKLGRARRLLATSTSTRTCTTSAFHGEGFPRLGRAGRRASQPARTSASPANYLGMPRGAARVRPLLGRLARGPVGSACRSATAAAWAHVAERFRGQRPRARLRPSSTSRGRGRTTRSCLMPLGLSGFSTRNSVRFQAKADRGDPTGRQAPPSSGTSPTCCSTAAMSRRLAPEVQRPAPRHVVPHYYCLGGTVQMLCSGASAACSRMALKRSSDNGPMA